MPYGGKQVMPRDHAHKARAHWKNYELTKAVATAIAESHLYLGAYHDNLLADGSVGSRDCGVYEFNIPASQIGTLAEDALRTELLDPTIYEPVWDHSVSLAWDYYNSPWTRNGHNDIRRWQAWAAYTTGWATFPHSWVWHHDADGNGVGPWVPTGRYIFKAIAGQMNNMIVNEKLWTPEVALGFGDKYAAHFGIQDGSTLFFRTDNFGNQILDWHYPAKPDSPPADGSGPYPVDNDGT
jgi:hypothetical protein